MRWNCPHCGVGLNVPDEQLGEGWCFSKCYQCSGFSLVRRSDSGAVRVDGTGQTGVGPSILEQSPWKLSQRALDAAKPVIRPAKARAKAAPAATPAPSPVEMAASAVQQLSKDIQVGKATVPPPFKVAPVEQPREPVLSGLVGRQLPPPLPEAIETNSSRLGRLAYRFVTRTIATAAVTVVGYAAYVWVTTPIPVATDAPAALARIAPIEGAANKAQTVAVQAPSITQSAQTVVTDSISRGAMAPDRKKEALNQAAISTSFEIEALSPKVQLRSGPGLQYSVVGQVAPARKYPVADWSERWFRIVVEKNTDGTGKTFAWVRNDLVKLVKKSH